MDIVKVRNTGDAPVVVRHDRHGNVTIQPGAEQIIPLDMAVVNYGNPLARNDGRNNLRDAEVKHVFQYHGFFPGIHPDAAWEGNACMVGLDPEDPRSWVGPFKPTVEIFDLETDARVFMVHDDPNGEHAAATVVPTGTFEDTALLLQRIASLEKALEPLLQMAANQQTAPVMERPHVPDNGEDIEPDFGVTGDDEPESAADIINKAMEQVQANRPNTNVSTDAPPPPPPGSDQVKQDAPRTPKSGPKRG